MTPAAKTQSKPKERAASVPAAQRGLSTFAPELADLDAGKFDATKAVAVNIPIKDIDEPTAMGTLPLDVEKVEQLAASIRVDGLLNPITVKRRGPKFELVAGRHRTYAHKALGLTEIPAIIRDDLDTAGTLAMATAENLVRRKLPPYEEARNYAALKEKAGLSEKDIAVRLGVSEATVKGRLQLLALPPEVGQRIGEPGFSQEHAHVLVPLVQHPKVFEAACKVVGKVDYAGHPLSADNFASEVWRTLTDHKGPCTDADYHIDQAAREKPEFKKRLEALRTVKFGAGRHTYAVIEDKKGLQQLEQDVKKWEAERQAKYRDRRGLSSPGKDYMAKEREKAYVTTEVRKRQRVAIGKAAAAVCTFGKREWVLAGAALLRGGPTLQPRDYKILAEASGIDVATLQSLGGGRSKKALEVLQQLANKKDDGATLGRLLSGLALLTLEDVSNYGGEGGSEAWREVSKKWFGETAADVRKKVQRDRAARKKKGAGGKKAKAGKKGKAAKAEAGTCSECGCTEDEACDPPCSWANEEQTLCSACGDDAAGDEGEEGGEDA